MNQLLKQLNKFSLRQYSLYKFPYNPLHPKAAEPPEDCDAPLKEPINPYNKQTRKCILCEYNVDLDYKNPRLLQQFVSTFSGRVYPRHITGLCTRQDARLRHMVAASRKMGLMPLMVKDPKYLRDPKLFNPMQPFRKHSFV